MLTVELKNGFKAKVDPEVLNDMYFFEALAEAEEEPLKFDKVCNMLLGKEQKRALYKSLEDKNGRVAPDVASEALTEIFEKMGEEGKNS